MGNDKVKHEKEKTETCGEQGQSRPSLQALKARAI